MLGLLRGVEGRTCDALPPWGRDGTADGGLTADDDFGCCLGGVALRAGSCALPGAAFADCGACLCTGAAREGAAGGAGARVWTA